MSEDASKTLVQPFVLLPRLLQLCSSVCISEGLINRLQSVQNAAARLVTGTRRSDHITPVLSQLYIGYRYARASTSSLATLVHRSLSGISPSYLANDRRLFADVRERRLYVRSTTCRTCIVSCDVDTFDDRGFAAAGPGLWNWLPSQAKEADLSFNTLRRSLKTFLLG